MEGRQITTATAVLAYERATAPIHSFRQVLDVSSDRDVDVCLSHAATVLEALLRDAEQVMRKELLQPSFQVDGLKGAAST
jgi:hypothetical protein